MNNIKLYLDKDSISYKDENGKIWCTTKRIDSTIPLIVFKEQTVEELAIDILNKENMWSHLFIFGNPKKPYPTNFERDLDRVMLGLYQAKSSDKKYTEEQVFDFLNNEDNYTEGELGNSCIDVITLKNYFKSLNQLKIPDVINLEMKQRFIDSFTKDRVRRFYEDWKLKTTSTPEGEIIEITI